MMKGKLLIGNYSVVEMRIKYYMKCLLVETPEHVIQYLEKKRLKKTFKCMLENRNIYPRIVVVSIQDLIKEYSLDVIRIKEYINRKKKDYDSPSRTITVGFNIKTGIGK
ncbi:hypothetical protein GCM10020331_087120 [Ectobacillus funiculus]